jgi:membrane-bound lytic murein transglycosylase F
MSGRISCLFFWLMFPVIMFSGCRGCRSYTERGDLEAIRDRGKLRIILPASHEDETLPREGVPLNFSRDEAERFAEELGLKPVLVYVENYSDLIESLLSGEGDLIATGLTVTEKRKKRVAFSDPIMLVKEQVVVRADDDTINKRDDLAGRRLAVRRSSSYWETLEGLREMYPGIELVAVEEGRDTEQIIHMVAEGEYDVTVADSNLVEEVKRYRDDVKAALDLTGDRPVAWAVRPGSKELLKELNGFIDREKLAVMRGGTYKDDLPGLKERKVLRVLTRNNAATYFLWRGKLMGFEYELAKEFAKRHGMRVKMIVPPSYDDLIPWLKQGKGDVVAASLTVTGKRRKEKGIAFSEPYNYVSEMVVARADEDGLDDVSDLAGRTLVVRKGSSYWQTLERLKDEGMEFDIQEAPGDMETEDIIERVARGEYDLTVSDSHILDIEFTYRDDIKGAFALTEKVPHAWAVRSDARELLSAINSFFGFEYRGLFYNITYNKYFVHERCIMKHVKQRAGTASRLSPYDDLVKKYAMRYAFDWRLITAQMYEESRFNPGAVSWAGAKGLMQLLPSTAAEIGFKDLQSPDKGVHAGVKYMYQLRSYFDTSLPLSERVNFALASYNAGYGHVLDARRLADRNGLDQDVWFDNVEKGMLMLSRPEHYRQARYGYCRGSEPVKYVREIRNRHAAYLDILSGP